MNVVSVRRRAAVLDAARSLKMAQSTHAYVRGNTAKFYQWLGTKHLADGIPDGPPVWICGDCHLGNLGPVSDGDGAIEVQIRDLDQTVIGNPAHDLIRLGLSLATAARASNLAGVTTALILEEMLGGYEHAMKLEDEEPGAEPHAVVALRQLAENRAWRQLANERLDDPNPTIPLGKRFWPLSKQERKAIDEMLAEAQTRDRILALNGKDGDRELRLVDAAYWMKGCSSLGLLRYAGIVAINGAKRREKFALIDIKQAVASVAPAAPANRMPRDQAQRVVAGAKALSPFLGERMIACKLLGKSVFVRELKPQDVKLEMEQFTKAQGAKAARYLAFVVGKAHAQQMGRKARSDWRRTLLAHRGNRIDAPAWLWRAVVELWGSHETGYLEDCRRYALAMS